MRPRNKRDRCFTYKKVKYLKATTEGVHFQQVRHGEERMSVLDDGSDKNIWNKMYRDKRMENIAWAGKDMLDAEA